MRTLTRWTGMLTALLAALNLMEIKRPAQIVFMLPKIMAGVFAPWLAVAGAAAALWGWLRKDKVALMTGLIGAGLAARHVARVSAPHDEFERTYGLGWEQRIPLERRAQMLIHRWQMQLPEPPVVRWEPNVVFGTSPETGQPLRCDMWLPPEQVTPTGLAVIYLHGSGWHYLDKDCGTATFFRFLAGQGHVVMDVAYSLAPHVGLHGMVGDVKRAIAWIKANADRYGVNPARVVLMGGSAGGHLSLLAGYTPDNAELRPADVGQADLSVCGVVAYYGAPDVEFYYRYTHEQFGDLWNGDTALAAAIQPVAKWSNEWLRQYFNAENRPTFVLPDDTILPPAHMMSHFLGGTPDELPELYRLASPITHVGPHCPPTLLISGSHDVAMKPITMRHLQNELHAAGVACLNVSIADTDHGFDLFFSRTAPAFQAALYDVERFLGLLACCTGS